MFHGNIKEQYRYTGDSFEKALPVAYYPVAQQQIFLEN